MAEYTHYSKRFLTKLIPTVIFTSNNLMLGSLGGLEFYTTTPISFTLINK